MCKVVSWIDRLLFNHMKSSSIYLSDLETAAEAGEIFNFF